jgi:hypothetical protein
MSKHINKDNWFWPLLVGHHQVTICTGLDSLRARSCHFTVSLRTIIYFATWVLACYKIVGGGGGVERKVILKSQLNNQD